MPSTILKLPEVLARTKLSRSQCYALIAEGAFPRQVRLACSAVGWLEAEIDLFIAERVAERDAAPGTWVASVASSAAAPTTPVAAVPSSGAAVPKGGA